jgi:hypothetical protein
MRTLLLRASSLASLALVLAAGGCGGGKGGGGGGTLANAPPSAPANATAAPAPTGGCETIPWREGDVVAEASYHGKLSIVDAEDANGRKERPLILTLDRPVCMPEGSDNKQTDEIQVYSPDAALSKQLEAALGKVVTITGEGFTSHTAHHHRPIVLEVKSISTK